MTLFTLIRLLRPGMHPSKCNGWNGTLGFLPYICRYCVLFPEQPGVLILSSYKGPCAKALGKDGVHDSTVMHHCASCWEGWSFLRHYTLQIDEIKRLTSRRKQTHPQIILATEFLAKQDLPLRGDRDDKVDFSADDVNRGNFVATLQPKSEQTPPFCKKKCQVYKLNHSEWISKYLCI